MKQKRKLVIVGDSAFAEIAFEYFDADSDYCPVAFAVEAQYLKRNSINNIPVVPFETLTSTHPSSEHDIYVAIVYSQLNRLRTRLAKSAKSSGYKLASYISSKCFIWRNVQMGEHVFIFEDNTIQPFVVIGDNVVLWSGNHIGHHSKISDNVFISSHVVISGFCTIGDNCFLGVNSAIGNNIEIQEDCWIGPGASIAKNISSDSIVRAPEPDISKIGARRFFKVK